MRIAKKYSHLNGEEWLLVHENDTYKEILEVISAIDAEDCRTKVSKEKRKKGETLYSPVALNKEFDARLSALGWEVLLSVLAGRRKGVTPPWQRCRK